MYCPLCSLIPLREKPQHFESVVTCSVKNRKQFFVSSLSPNWSCWKCLFKTDYEIRNIMFSFLFQISKLNILKSDTDINSIFKSFETHLHLIVKTSEVGSTPYLNSLRADEMKTADVFSSISACSESSIIAH